jgi:uncharacterized protein YkwD
MRGRSHRWAWMAVVAALVVPIVVVGGTTAPVAAASAPTDAITVRITDSAIAPAAVVLVGGQTLIVENTTTETVTVAASNGEFDSGPIAPGGAFVAAIRSSSTIEYQVAGDDARRGRIDFGLRQLPGTATVNARSNLPLVEPPPTDPADFGPHPDYGLSTSRTQIIVLPTTTATIGALNTVLAEEGLTVIGSFPILQSLAVVVPDPGDHSNVLAALERLRSPGRASVIAAAAPVWPVETTRVPRPPDLPNAGSEGFLSMNRALTGDWGNRFIRAAAAWNLIDAARRARSSGPKVETLVIDPRLADRRHPDLRLASVSSQLLPTGSHGTHVTGIIGARFDNGTGSTSAGMSGVNPVVDVHSMATRGSSFRIFESSSFDVKDFSSMFEEVLREKRTGGRWPNLRVINASFGAAAFKSPDVEAWSKSPAGSGRCGPLENDDALSSSNDPCLPSNHDGFRSDLRALATVYAERVLEAALSRNVVIVKSAGNAADRFCDTIIDFVVPCSDPSAQTVLPLGAAATNEFLLARTIRTAQGRQSPVLIVEAVDSQDQLASFSQRGGDVAAPGVDVRSTTIMSPEQGQGAPLNTVQDSAGAWYGEFDGTSMAAPFVTGAVGFVLALRPNLSAMQVVDLVRNSGRAVAGEAPRLEMFNLVVRADGARKLADLNDVTADGNSRVVYDDQGRAVRDDPRTGSGTDDLVADLGPRTTSPDDKVDLRDLRRFRDLWLRSCADGTNTFQAANPSPVPCPAPADIQLDGDETGPKWDANGDGCVLTIGLVDPNPNGNCTLYEVRWSRADLNGDGKLSISEPAPMFINATGAAATTATQMTDLDVLRAAFDRTPATIDGWPVSELIGSTTATSGIARLMISADLDVRLRGFDPTVTDLRIHVNHPNGTLQVPVTRNSNELDVDRIVTVPVAADATAELAVWVTGIRNGTPVRSLTRRLTGVGPGADRVVRVCPAGLNLTSSAPVLVPGATATLSTSVGCPGEAAPVVAPGSSVEYTVVAGAATDPPQIASPVVNVASDGRTSTTITPGLDPGIYEITAVMSGGFGPPLTATTTISVVPSLQVRYRWAAEVTSVTDSGSTDWSDEVAGRPDCREIPGFPGCVVASSTRLTESAPRPTLERDGTLTLTASGVRLDEQVSGVPGSLTTTYTWEELGGDTTAGTLNFSFGPAPNQSVTNRPVNVKLRRAPDGSIEVDGFRFLSEVLYRSTVTDVHQGPAPDPGVFGVPGELLPLSVPSDTGIQHAADPKATTVIRPADGGGFDTSIWCGTTSQRYTRPPGYLQPQLDPLLSGAVSLLRDPTYDPGDIPMPTANGRIERHVRVAFTAAVGGTAPAPVLPTCDGSTAPAAAFELAPQPDGSLDEGDAIQFLDRSTDADDDITDWAWTFGDGRSSRVRDPLLVPGLDDGTFTVALRVTDSTGRTSRTTRSIVVANRPPSIELLTPVVVVAEGARPVLDVVVDDPGPVDRKALIVTARRDTSSGSLLAAVTTPAGPVRLSLDPLPVGTHTVAVRVDDGRTQAHVLGSVIVTAEEVAPVVPPPPEPVTVSTCATPTRLSSVEADLLERWNRSRLALGLPVLALSSELTAAAATMASASLGTPGLAAGVDLGAVLADAGYAGRLGARVLTHSRADGAPATLEALRSNEVTTVFSTSAQMVGIAFVARGVDAKWVVVVGDVVDCDADSVDEGRPPELTVVPPAGPVDEGALTTVGVTATDPDDDIAEVRVDWGDGTVSGTSHRYRDDGTFDLRVRVIDEQGNVATAGPFPITVRGVAPEVALNVGPLVAGQSSALDVAAVDPAELDRPQRLQVSSVPAGAVSFDGPLDGGRTLVVTPPAGASSVEITAVVTDPDGVATTVSTGTLPVAASPPPPPTPPSNVDVTAPTCTNPVGLRAQSAEFVARANVFRQSFGLAELTLAPELQAAAEAHLADMKARRYFSHFTGLTATNTPLDRARIEGYTGGVGENIAMRFPTAEHALIGFRASPPHLENLLDPVWRATGVAVDNGPDGVLWVQVFGTTPTCPSSPYPAPSPVVLENPPLDRTAPVAAWPANGLTPAALDAVAGVVTAEPAPRQVEAPPDAEVAAFTVDRLRPSAGQVVTVVNRSRLDGVPVSGTLTFGTLSPRLLAHGASFARAVFADQAAVLTAAGLTTGVAFTTTGTYDPLVAVLSPAEGTTVVQGALVTVQARVTDPNGDPLPGVRVRVAPTGGSAVFGATATNGVATVDVRVPTAGDSVPVVVEAERADGTFGGTNVVGLRVLANLPPTVDAGGPYLVEIGSPLQLDPPAATDPDGDTIASYAWDLDGDGEFDDLASKDASVPWATVTSLLCGGSCTVDQTVTIRLRATDSKGASADAEATVVVIRDFGLVVTPPTFSLPPGTSAQLRIDVFTTSGFAENVTLTAPGLPTGITATFNPVTVKPGTPSTMTVSVASTVSTAETIPITVTGTAQVPTRGTVQRTASPEVSVLFGLQPTCTVQWSGRLVDAVTGEPVKGAVRLNNGVNILTGDDGSWTISSVPLGSNNAPRTNFVSGLAGSFHPSPAVFGQAVCGVDRDDFVVVIHRILEVTVRARVFDADDSKLVPRGASARLGSSTSSVDSDGYALFKIPLAGPANGDNSVSAFGQASGYHDFTTGVTVTPAQVGSVVDVNIPITRICQSTWTGGTVTDPDGRPVGGARVRLTTGFGFTLASVLTDEDGRYSLSYPVQMAPPRNGDVTLSSITIEPPVDRTDLTATGSSYRVTGCQAFEVPLQFRFNPTGIPRYAAVTVRVVDPDGAPVPEASVQVSKNSTHDGTTDGDGEFRVEQLTVGFVNPADGREPDPGNASVIVRKGPYDLNNFPLEGGWWPAFKSVQVGPGQDVTVDVVLEPARFGTIRGRVVDVVTGEPIGGVTVMGRATTVTAADGTFSYALRLNQTGATGDALGVGETSTYWGGGATALFEGTADTVDVEIRLLRKCPAATVTGIVVDNTTLAPIAGATVAGGGASATTGADGVFQMTVAVGTNNAPRNTSLTASAPGYNSLTRQVTVFCGAQLVVDFAPPPPGVGTVTGVVRDPDGAPAVGIFVGSSWGVATTTAADGSYTITGAPSAADGGARSWTVTAVPPTDGALLPASAPVSLAAGETKTVDLTLRRQDDPPPPNRPPTAVVSPAAPSTPEGTPVVLSAAGSSDPDGDPILFAWDVDGDGFDDGFGPTLTFLRRQPGTHQVRVRVTDGRGGESIAQATVTVTNVVPTVSAGGDATTGTDGVFARMARSFTDPGDGDVFTVTARWGDGSPVENLPRFGRSFDMVHTYRSAGTYQVTITVCDASGGCGTGTFKVTVPAAPSPDNQPPVARVTAPTSVPEGGSITFDASSSTDPERGALRFSWDTDGDGRFGDATGPVITVIAGGPGSRAAAVRVTDPQGATSIANASVTVRNVAPVVDPIPDVRVATGASVRAVATVRDATRATGGYRATIEWGDGTGGSPVTFTSTAASDSRTGAADGALVVGTIALEHRYAEPGVYTAVVTVCDTSCSARTFRVTASAPASSDDLVVTVAVPSSATVDTTTTATVTVRNAGTAPASPVVTVALVSGNGEIVALAGTGWSCQLASSRCSLAEPLPPGGVASLAAVIALRGSDVPVVEFAAQVVGSNVDANPSDNQASAVVTVAPAGPNAPPVGVLPETGATRRPLWLPFVLILAGLGLLTVGRDVRDRRPGRRSIE